MREECILLQVVVPWLHSCSGRHVLFVKFLCLDMFATFLLIIAHIGVCHTCIISMVCIERKERTMYSSGISNILIMLFDHHRLHFHAEIKMEIMHFQESCLLY